MNVGYVRVSSKDQNIERQVKSLREKGVEKLFIDKISGKDTNRPELKSMLEYVREGDTLYFVSISRLARNTKDFLELMDMFKTKSINVICLKESIDTTTPQGKMISTIFASMYELERENIKIRQKEGIKIAKKNGVKFGRPKKEILPDFVRLYPKWKAKEISSKEFMERIEMKPNTFYRRIKEYEDALKE